MGSMYIKNVIRVAVSYEGYHEGSNNWNIFADRLDKCGYYAPQKKQNIQWCGSFINASMLEAATPDDRDDDSKKYDAQYFQFQPSYWNCSAGVREMADYYKAVGEFYTDDPHLGDVIFFNSVDTNGNVIATYQHVGLIIDLGDEYITTEEGNAGDMVQRKYYRYSEIGTKIEGFGRPRYDGYEDPADIDHKPEPVPSEDVTVTLHVLSRGSTGGQVNTLKALLNEFGFSDNLPLDGDFDYDTEVAVNRYKENYGLTADGIVDEDTWKLLLL